MLMPYRQNCEEKSVSIDINALRAKDEMKFNLLLI